MALHIVINEHTPEECAPMEEHLDRIPAFMRGKDFYCTCPAGVHGFVMFLEGETAQDIVQTIPAELRKGTRAIPVDVFKFPV